MTAPNLTTNLDAYYNDDLLGGFDDDSPQLRAS
jgi:hypothetical protein